MPKEKTLAPYRKKRDFTRTSEPPGAGHPQKSPTLFFVVQKHAARQLHYDFRLEMDGVLKSWAVPRGPSLDPNEKRLAVHVEDHPLEYGNFEGIIPAGEYGGGTVMLWDRGTWEPAGDMREAYQKGSLDFDLQGERLKGKWHLVRMKRGSGHDNWLLIKSADRYADKNGAATIEKYQKSVASKRTMEEIAQGGAVYNSNSSDPKPEKKRKKISAKAPPDFIAPQLATMVKTPPSTSDWIHEVKFDGYRTLARIEDGAVRMLTRADNDWTSKFRGLAGELERLDIANAILDGEIVAVGEDGQMSFHALQQALSEDRHDVLHYYIFDLMFLNGQDFRQKPLSERKQELRKLIPQNQGHIHYSEHFDSPGPEVFHHACGIALEGIVSKRKSSPYRSGRTKAWLKAKCLNEQEVVIGGFTFQPRHKDTLAALLTGTYRGENLVYAGKVGTGFTTDEAKDLLKKLKPLVIEKPPFENIPQEAGRHALWVKPVLVVQVFFNEWTDAGLLRQPSYQGLREDKPPKQVVKETESKPTALGDPPKKKTVAGVKIGNADKVLYPERGITKSELADYFEFIADLMLPHVAGRPISLVRCPDGRAENCIFQRHPLLGLSPDIKTVLLAIHEPREYLMIDNVKGLIALAQLAVLEIHTWGARADAIDRPDRLVFDLDPGEDVAWENVKQAARDLRERLKEMRLESFLLTTGGKGLHVVVPINQGPGWKEVKDFTRDLAKQTARDSSSHVTMSLRKADRIGRIYIDYLRNGKGASFIAPYSPRARENAPVATPLEWKELTALASAHPYDLRTIIPRIKKLKTVWREVTKIKQKLPQISFPSMGEGQGCSVL
jgi:bifunctional non-homologous end joining protein LigD